MKIEFLVSRKYPSFPARADKTLARHSSPVVAQSEVIRLSKRLRGGAVSVLKSIDTRIVSYDMFVRGELVRYGVELDRDWRQWQHFDVKITPWTALLNGDA